MTVVVGLIVVGQLLAVGCSVGGNGNPTYMITYDGNGNTGGSVPVDSNNYEEKQTVTVLGNTGNLLKTDYTFMGWNTKADGSGNDYVADDTFEMGSSNLTLYANWIALKRQMISVPGGTYTQEDIDGNSFSHTISAFQMAKYEVTYELWYIVRDWARSNGYTFAHPGREGDDGTIIDPEGAAPTTIAKYEPVTTINWRDAIVWCNAYSEMAGFMSVYYTDEAMTTPLKVSTNVGSVDTTTGSEDNPYVNWSANGYRLPTEGEWQYVASYQDGTSWTPYNYASGDSAPYDTSTTIGNYAWYSDNSSDKTHDVGTKLSNQLGIHDVSGNVFEWCWDWEGTWPTTEQTDYRGPGSGSVRVERGGSWVYGDIRLQVGFRGNFASPFTMSNHVGFRPVRTQ